MPGPGRAGGLVAGGQMDEDCELLQSEDGSVHEPGRAHHGVAEAARQLASVPCLLQHPVHPREPVAHPEGVTEDPETSCGQPVAVRQPHIGRI